MSSFDYAGPLSEVVVLGNIALLHPGATLEWDAEKHGDHQQRGRQQEPLHAPDFAA